MHECIHDTLENHETHYCWCDYFNRDHASKELSNAELATDERRGY